MARRRMAKSAKPVLGRIARGFENRWRPISRGLRVALAGGLVLAVGIVLGVALTGRTPAPKPAPRLAQRTAEAPIAQPAPSAETPPAVLPKPAAPAAPRQDAMLPPPTPAPSHGEPPWLRFAVAPPAIEGRA